MDKIEKSSCYGRPGIYMIFCFGNGRHYIGSSKDIYIRIYAHINTLKNQKHINTYLQNAFDKYGEENFEFM